MANKAAIRYGHVEETRGRAHRYETYEGAAEGKDSDSRHPTSSLHKIKRIEDRCGRVHERRSRTRNLLYGIESMSGEAKIKSKVVGNVSGEDTGGGTGTPTL